jgi:hypothetical protein
MAVAVEDPHEIVVGRAYWLPTLFCIVRSSVQVYIDTELIISVEVVANSV